VVDYVPRKGDIVYLDFDAQAGHEQRRRRPALVVSNDVFNQRTGLCIACPITSTSRGFPLHLPLPEGLSVTGFVMIEQVMSVDFRFRRAQKAVTAPAAVLNDALALLDACLY